MTAPELFVEHDRTWLSRQSQRRLDVGKDLLEVFDRHRRTGRRVQGQGVQVFPALGRRRDGFGLGESTHKIVGDEALNAMHSDMLIILRIHQMLCKLATISALIAFEDHAPEQSARTRSSRICPI
jgi:hypothetical protein